MIAVGPPARPGAALRLALQALGLRLTDRGGLIDRDRTSATVADLVRKAEADPPGLALRVNRPVSADPAYLAILDAVR